MSRNDVWRMLASISIAAILVLWIGVWGAVPMLLPIAIVVYGLNLYTSRVLTLNSCSCVCSNVAFEAYGRSCVKHVWLIASVFAILCFVMYGLCRGILNEKLVDDFLYQWNQAHGLVPLTDWHPAIHTLLFYKLPTLVWDDIRMVRLVHMLFLAFASGYAVRVLRYNRIKWVFVAGAFFLMVANPCVLRWVLVPSKDTVFTAACLILCCQLGQMLVSSGAWGRSKRNVVALVSMMGLVCLIRHNGLFVTLFSLPLLWKWLDGRRTLVIAIAVMALVSVIRGPTYRILGVTDQNWDPAMTKDTRMFVESQGLPLSILGAVFVGHPDRVPKEVVACLESVASHEQWKRDYDGTFNSVKFKYFKGGHFYRPCWQRWPKLIVDTIKIDPKAAWHSFLTVTKQVWCPFSAEDGLIVARGGMVSRFVRFAYLMNGCGLIMLSFFFLVALFPSVATYVLPWISYDIGTMFLLSGYDSRFFLFMPVIFPIVFLLALGSQRWKHYDFKGELGLE